MLLPVPFNIGGVCHIFLDLLRGTTVMRTLKCPFVQSKESPSPRCPFKFSYKVGFQSSQTGLLSQMQYHLQVKSVTRHKETPKIENLCEKGSCDQPKGHFIVLTVVLPLKRVKVVCRYTVSSIEKHKNNYTNNSKSNPFVARISF